MANTVILPAALRYQTELATNVISLKAAGVDADSSVLNEVSAAIKALREGIDVLRANLAEEYEGVAERVAASMQSKDLSAMGTVRTAADELETLVADDLWPLATYQEMLYIL
jgi:glutamine synthetase